MPLATPGPPRPATPPRPIPLPPRPRGPPRTELCLPESTEGGTLLYLLAGFELVGGFSTNEVSVVKNVASGSSLPARCLYAEAAAVPSRFLVRVSRKGGEESWALAAARAKEAGMGA